MNNLSDTYTLSNGYKIPVIGFGTWQTENGDIAVDSVVNALEAGYRHIDTAAMYGNEVSVGKGLVKSGIAREEVFVTTKMWNSERGYDKALKAFHESLDKLALEYLDLYLIHWPAAKGSPEQWSQVNADTWRAFEKLYEEGLVKAIGVSNFKPHHLQPLIDEAKIAPMVNQIEFHPGFNQEATRAFCKDHNIVVEAWSPLGSGRVLSDERLEKIASSYNCSVAQLCIRWCLQHDTLPLPKSTNADRIKANTEVFAFMISDEDMAFIDALPEFGTSGNDPDTVTF